MVEHTDNQKKRGNAENKTAFYYIRYRQANVSRILALIFCLEIVTASKLPVCNFFYDRQRRRQTSLVPRPHPCLGARLTTDGQNRLLNRAYAARGNN